MTPFNNPFGSSVGLKMFRSWIKPSGKIEGAGDEECAFTFQGIVWGWGRV